MKHSAAMELIRGLQNLRPRHHGCVATIGAFDGMHHGHRAVLGQLLEKSEELGLPSVAVLFEPLPREYFSPAEAAPRLMSFREKFLALQDMGLDRALRVRFDAKLQTMRADDFTAHIFVEGLGVRCIVLGDDMRFGHGREGDFELLKQHGEHYGFQVMRTATLGVSGNRVSSTRIRQALGDADFPLAQELLGRPYRITGKVVYGAQRGHGLGAPTANLELHRLKAPVSGVFLVEVDGVATKALPGVANVGIRPTLNDSIRANLEVHILNFSGDLYGRRIGVTFLEKVREEQKFASVELLIEQIQKDIARAHRFFKT